MKKTLLALCALISLSAQAQISTYQHPCSVIAQQEVEVERGEAFTPQLDWLILHDVDDNFAKEQQIKLLKGDGYKIDGDRVIPSPKFEGMLEVNIQVKDEKFTSDVFPLRVAVGSRKEGHVLYVSPQGNDSADGSLQHPLKSLEGARKAAHRSGANTIYFREGEYFMDKSVEFTAEDSGSNDTPTIYCAYPGEKVRFTGSVKLPYESFKKASPKQLELIDNIYLKAKIKVIDLHKLGITDFGEIGHVGYAVKKNPLAAARLYINGAAMQIARYPNVGNFDDVRIMTGDKRVTRNIATDADQGAEENKIRFKSKSGVMFNWKQKDDIWIDGSMSKAWEWQKNKIAQIDPDSTITMTWDYHSKIGMQAVKMFYFNVFEELDFPEEYYVDQKNGLLYVYFPSSVTESADIRLTQSHESFVVMNGVSNITFRNITFEGTRDTAIDSRGTSSFNTIERCEIYSCGLNGVVIDGYSNRVKDCWIHNIGANGVMLRGGDVAKMKPAGNVVENTKIHDFSQERRVYNPGLNISGFGQVVRHIELFNGPHMGCVIRGANHIIEYSNFHDTPRDYSDMLGIYLCTGGDLLSRGTIIRRNRFHDVSGSWKQSAGVYMDNETYGVVVEENYFYNNIAQENGWSVMIHGGGDNQVRRNTFVDCSFPFSISTRLNGYARNWFDGILENWEKQAAERLNKRWTAAYPEMLHYFVDEGERVKDNGKFEFKPKRDKDGEITNYWNLRTPSSNVFKDNLVYNSDPATFAMSKSSPKGNLQNRGYYVVNNFRVKDGKLQECLIHSNNHNVSENPGFADASNYDLRVKESAPIIKDLPHLREQFFPQIGLSDKSRVGVE